MLASLFLVMQDAQADTSWRVYRGPNGTKKIDTPNGIYIEENKDGYHWIGTEGEYNRKESIAHMEENGFQEFPLKGAKKDDPPTFVYDWLPQAWVGSVHLGGISSYIYFDMLPNKGIPAPPKPEGSKYVNIGWAQDEKADVQAQIIDTQTHQSYSAFFCENEQNHFRACYFTMPGESLSHRSSLIFSLGKAKSDQIENGSITGQMRQVILHLYKPESGKRRPLTPTHAAMLEHLHEIDNSIATTLPLLPNEIVEVYPPKGGCSKVQQVLTADQFNAIKQGESLEQVQCLYGAGTPIKNTSLHQYYWKSKDYGFVVVTLNEDQQTIRYPEIWQSQPY